jgi:DnaJ like chaperone protein
MDFWSKLAKMAVGRLDDASCLDCPAGLPGEDPAFATAVTALGAKLAKADGRAVASEYDAFIQVFQPEPGSEKSVERLYELARQTTLGFESYAKRLAKRYANCPQLLEDVLDGLFFIAARDGEISGGELIYLEDVARHLGLSPLVYRRVKSMHLQLPDDDPYVVLQVAPDIDDDGLKAAWRKAISAAHPDRVRARGLPDEFVDVAEAKSAAINAAYDLATRERLELSRS